MAGGFNLSTLNGVSFDGDHLGKVLAGSSLWASNDSEASNQPVIYGTGVASGLESGTGEVTVYYDYYLAGYTRSDGSYQSPVFGLVKFENSPGQVYYVRGFGEDGRSIILTNGYNAITAGSTGVFPNTYAYVISLDTLTHYDSSNLPVGIPYHFSNEADDIATFEGGLLALCFAEGTRIATPEGMVTVESLTEGAQVLTASGAIRPVKWVGEMISRPARHPRPWQMNPVRITAHSFGRGVPAQDVRLSPGHALFVDGVLVPVGHLVNGATIVQEEVEQIRYFHVELDSHDVLLAEGLPCESYLDDGNRRAFANNGDSVELFGRLDPKNWDDACAPVVAGGPQLFELQQQLHARAGELGWVKNEDPELQIIINGAEIKPVRAEGNRYLFNVPVGTALTLHSKASVLAQIMPGVDDTRRLGVAVASIHIDGEMLDLESGALGKGFYPAEGHGWRWTDGNAEFVLPIEAPAMVEITLAMIAPSWKRLSADLQVAA